MSAPKPRVRNALRVAVTGHRLNQLPENKIDQLTAATDSVMARLEQAHAAIAAGEAVNILRTALAEGADRIATRLAHDRGWRTESVLPFGPSRYVKDFTDIASASEFLAMLQQSSLKAVMEGERLEVEINESAPYAEAARALIDRVQAVLAIWNGLPPKGPGGTAEVAALALDQGSFVIWISVDGERIKLVPPAPLPRAGSFRRKLYDALTKTFERVPRPPEMRVA